MPQVQDFFSRRWPDPGMRAMRAATLLGRHCHDALRELNSLEDGLAALYQGLAALYQGLGTHLASARAAQDFCERAQACFRADGSVDEAMYRAMRAEWGGRPAPRERDR